VRIKRKGAGSGKAAPFHGNAPRSNGCAFVRSRQSLNIKDHKTWSYYNPARASGTTNSDAFTTFGTYSNRSPASLLRCVWRGQLASPKDTQNATAGTVILELKLSVDIILAEDGKYYSTRSARPRVPLTFE
jgi:hypothetical protein